ncbi:NAD(P)/FAD-dependent oxidoreductase [Nocardioides luti]|uniref:NAD(P)/FAD-dependent oxidoreductase n=1 Tax=Nocardioides luti TaxID=2761101 RepID=UPI0031B5E372
MPSPSSHDADARPVDTDLLIIGAGPTGLFAAYYAGFRGLRVAVVDSLPELGGQITAMYPEKQILDVAGFPSIKGRDLVEGLVAQATTADPAYFLDRTATTLRHETSADGDERVVVGLDDGREISAGAVLITAGIGKFSPRPLPAGDGWLGRGLEFFVPSFAPYAGKDVVIVGGGDSAFDWALHLEPVARSVTLVHRRDAFRAHARTVEQVRASSVRIVTKAEVTAFRGNGHVEALDVTADGEQLTLPAQAVVAALGFIADLGPLQQWGIEVEKRHVVVNPAMRTSLERVFAAGDITEYAGKVRLIAVGFGEAATAVNNAAVAIDPSAHVFPGHSSEGS